MTFSQLAWKHASTLIEKIMQHPFNQELSRGTLDRRKFAYYIEQDSHYLHEFARAHAILASKMPLKHVRTFLAFSDYTFVAEQELVHDFFKQTLALEATHRTTSATISYTQFLLKSAALDEVEVGLAAVLPCFWIYQEVGLKIHRDSAPNNPYARWIETYSSDDFAQAVKKAIDITDELAAQASDATRDKMLDAFYKSTSLEWHFWNDAYHLEAFDDLNPVGRTAQ